MTQFKLSRSGREEVRGWEREKEMKGSLLNLEVNSELER